MRLFKDKWGDWRGWTVVAFVGAIGVAFLGAILIGTYHLESAHCRVKADGMGRDHRYSLIGECRVEADNGRYVPLDTYRLTDEERGR